MILARRSVLLSSNVCSRLVSSKVRTAPHHARHTQAKMRNTANPRKIIESPYKTMASKPSTQAPASTSAITQWPARLGDPEQKLVLDCAKLAWLAYSDPSTVATWWTAQQAGTLKVDTTKPSMSDVMPRICKMPQFVSCPECDAQCYLLMYNPPKGVKELGAEPVLVIAARGTTSLMDWMCNAQAYQAQFRDATDKPVNGVELHSGFYRQFISLLSKVDVGVQKHLKGGGKVICVGHSLGGAISTIAALNYGNTYPQQVWHASFGSPRVGNQAFKEAYAKCTKLQARVKHERDPVVSILPPIDYWHVGPETHLGEADPCPDIPILLDVGDHDMAKYVSGIQNPAAAQAIVPATSSTGNWLFKAMSAFRI